VAVKAPQRAYFTAFMACWARPAEDHPLPGCSPWPQAIPQGRAAAGQTAALRTVVQSLRHADRVHPGPWFPVLPLPLKVFVVSAAALKTPFSKFLIVILLARVIAISVKPTWAYNSGRMRKTFLARHIWMILGSWLALAGGAYVLIGMIDRRRERAV